MNPRANPPRRLTGTDPAANAEISVIVPTGALWGLLAVTVALVQGITDTPRPILVIDDGTNVVYESFGSSAVQVVSTTCRYTWAEGLELSGQVGATTNVHSNAPLPHGLVLPAGYRIRTSTIGLAATANYGAPGLLIVEY